MRLIGALVPYASNSTGQDIFRAALMDYWDARFSNFPSARGGSVNLAEKLVMRLIGALVPYASNSTGQDIFRAALMDYWDARITACSSPRSGTRPSIRA
jgi:hypothetical protein